MTLHKNNNYKNWGGTYGDLVKNKRLSLQNNLLAFGCPHQSSQFYLPGFKGELILNFAGMDKDTPGGVLFFGPNGACGSPPSTWFLIIPHFILFKHY